MSRRSKFWKTRRSYVEHVGRCPTCRSGGPHCSAGGKLFSQMLAARPVPASAHGLASAAT